MIPKALAYSAIVVAITVIGLLAIWGYDLILECYRTILEAGDWIATVVIVLSALALLVCRWWVVWKRRTKPRACDKACTPSGSPYPAPG